MTKHPQTRETDNLDMEQSWIKCQALKFEELHLCACSSFHTVAKMMSLFNKLLLKHTSLLH